MQSSGQVKPRGSFSWICDWSKASVPMAEGIFESFSQDVNADINDVLYGVTVPSHLLFLDHALRNDLVDR
ncbi:MAG: hypothetical protein ABI380_02550 [Edaphobacter sp.]